MKKKYITIWIILYILAGAMNAFSEDDNAICDYSDDLRAYAQAVAQLNNSGLTEKPGDGAKRRSKTDLYAVLCKTDGSKLFFEGDAQHILAGPRNCYTLFFASLELAEEAAESLKKYGNIIYAECDSTVKAATSEGESGQFHSSGAERMNFNEYLLYAAEWGSGSSRVAVVDSGCYPHTLIRPKLRTGGFDYVDADYDTSNDVYGHGTNVAGVIADCTINANVYIYPIRVLDDTGNGKMSNVVNAVREASQSGCDVINLSIESTVMSEALDDAILQAVSSGTAVVVSAGNDACSTSVICPAHLNSSGVIVVGSAEGSEGNYSRASYSNYGTSVDVYAFGSSISCCTINGGYSSATGTSIAAPHISANCALMKLIHPGLSPSQMETRLIAASSGKGTINVPDLAQMIPQTMGFHLSNLKMDRGGSLHLPQTAFPASSSEHITYRISGDGVVSCNEGTIVGMQSGSTVVTATCTGLEDVQFEVTVDNSEYPVIAVPTGVKQIEASAFEDDASIRHVVLPNGMESIGEYAFDHCERLADITMPASIISINENNSFSGAVLLCEEDSATYLFAAENGLQYILDQ